MSDNNNETQARERAEWLQSLPSVTSAQPITLEICTGGKHNETIPGALYVETFTPPVGSRNPERTTRVGLYLARVPLSYVRRQKPPRNKGESAVIYSRPVCYVPDSASGMDLCEMYVAGYYVGEVREFQPFGDNCLMFSQPVGRIDEFEPNTYRRIPVKVRDVPEA